MSTLQSHTVTLAEAAPEQSSERAGECTAAMDAPNLFTPPTAPQRRVVRDLALVSEPPERALEKYEKPASPLLPHCFAVALKKWYDQRLEAGQDDASLDAVNITLLDDYERICEKAIDELEDRKEDAKARRQKGEAAAFAAEADLLRGERASWRLLQDIFADWGMRQPDPPPYPEPPEDWGEYLRSFGPPAPYLNDSVAESRTRELHETVQPDHDVTALSRVAAGARPELRSLHDEKVQEEAIRRADPLLRLGQTVAEWLERLAYERIETNKGQIMQKGLCVVDQGAESIGSATARRQRVRAWFAL